MALHCVAGARLWQPLRFDVGSDPILQAGVSRCFVPCAPSGPLRAAAYHSLRSPWSIWHILWSSSSAHLTASGRVVAFELHKPVHCSRSVMPLPVELVDADHSYCSHRTDVVDYRSTGNEQHRCGRWGGDDHCGCDAQQRRDRRYVNCLASRPSATLSFGRGLTFTARHKSRYM